MAKPEILAPAGDFERLKAAVLYGADAVYLGLRQFGMRAAPGNFTEEELFEAVRFCHRHGVRAYLTLNTLPRNHELANLPAFFAAAKEAKADALIVADIGLLMLARRQAPEIELHVSTQAGVMNHLTAAELFRLGAKRAVLARELSLDEIREIREKVPQEMEIEAFVHGSMCMSVSGRCVISNYLTGRDANRGECSQPCRWAYHLVEEKRPGLYLPVVEDERGSYLLNAKDLSMIGYVDRLAEAGITSFKIEGRAKSAYYCGIITNAYRMAVDGWAAAGGGWSVPGWLVDEVHTVSHREYSTGFYFGPEEAGQCYRDGGYVRDWEVSGVVTGCVDGMLVLSERNRFSKGDTLELVLPGKRPAAIEVERMFDGEGNPIESANHPEMTVQIPFCGDAPPGAFLRRRTAAP